jgi:uncharacterized coiled-coil protein SlyX
MEHDPKLAEMAEQANDMIASLELQRNAAMNELAKAHATMRSLMRKIEALEKKLADATPKTGDGLAESPHNK